MKTLASKSKDEIISILTNYQNGEGGELGESYGRFMKITIPESTIVAVASSTRPDEMITDS